MPKKLDVSIEVPDELDIEHLRGKGKLDHEDELPDTPAPRGASLAPPPANVERVFEFNPSYLQQLKDMGFPENGAKKALWHTKNEGVEQATNWLFEHINDLDFGDPFVVPDTTVSTGGGGGLAAPSLIGGLASGGSSLNTGTGQQTVAEVGEQELASILSMGFDERQAKLALQLNVSPLKKWGLNLVIFQIFRPFRIT